MIRFLAIMMLLIPSLLMASPKVTERGDTLMIGADFRSVPIPDAVFSRMKGKSFKNDCTVERGDLRYLTVLICDGNGLTARGEMVCNREIARDLLEIFYDLYQAKYPIDRMELIDNFDADDVSSMEANNSSCFNFRRIAGRKKLSKHALGMAVDINPLYNPWVRRNKDGSLNVSPESGRRYADRRKDFKYKIDKSDLAYRLFLVHGFQWGGAWNSSKDYQHFEK